MDWSSGFTSRYRAFIVDAGTWRDVSEIDVMDGSIDRYESGLMESAGITVSRDIGETWIRIYLEAEQGGLRDRVALFTGLTSSPSVDWDGARQTRVVDLQSVLLPSSDTLMPRGAYIPSTVYAPQAAADLLRVGAAPVTYTQTDMPRLESAIIAEGGETNLSMAWKIVDAIGWTIRVSGMGEISIEPIPEEPVQSFDTYNDVIEDSISEERDWYSAPNVFRAVCGDTEAIARDDDETSYLSTVSRMASRGGTGEIWAEDAQAALGDGESIAAYAWRKLKSAQSVGRTIRYDRRFDPQVRVGDIVGIHHAMQEIDGLFRVKSQTIELSHNARTNEEVVNVI